MSYTTDVNQTKELIEKQQLSTSHPLIKHLAPSVEDFLRGKTEVIEIALQLNHTQHLPEAPFPHYIPLLKKKSNSPHVRTSYPLLYQREEVGQLHLTQLNQPPLALNNTVEEQQKYQKISKTISFLLKRYQATTLSHHYLGKPLSLMGYSEEALKLDEFIEKAANTFCPVIIRGDSGSEKISVASAIHYNSNIKHKPFIEINCSALSTEEFQNELLQGFERAEGGCIYFHSIDELSMQQQHLLINFLAVNTLSNQPSNIVKNIFNVRLLVSTTHRLKELVKLHKFSNDLYEKFNFLKLEIPSLAHRKKDIPVIVQELIETYRLFPEQTFTTEAKQALYNYHWPKNYQEIEQTIARLLALSTANPINIQNLQKYTPELLLPVQEALTETPTITTAPNTQIVHHLQNKNYHSLTHLHKGLQKALEFLAENYTKHISLTSLSEHVYISPSHLSYLFKHHIHKTFKQVLTELRILHAKHIISITPHSLITNVSLDVGFGDLSHFEKMFKRYTNMTPREYKNLIKSQRINQQAH